jgi:hypothetical protein
VAIQIKQRIPPVARHGAFIYPRDQVATYFFILLVLHRVLLERLISDALQVIHKGLSMGQHVVHVTALAPTEPVKAPEDSPDIPTRNSPQCLSSWLVLEQGWFYLSGVRIVHTRPRPLLRVNQTSYQTV